MGQVTTVVTGAPTSPRGQRGKDMVDVTTVCGPPKHPKEINRHRHGWNWSPVGVGWGVRMCVWKWGDQRHREGAHFAASPFCFV